MLIEKFLDETSLDQSECDSESRPHRDRLGLRRKRKFKRRLREAQEVAPRTPIPIDESEAPLCLALWRSVVMQGIYDISGRDGNRERKLIRAEGLSWFSQLGVDGEMSDFEYVCDLANLQPTRVMAIVKEVRENGKEIIDSFNFRTLRRSYSSRTTTRPARKNFVKSPEQKEKLEAKIEELVF